MASVRLHRLLAILTFCAAVAGLGWGVWLYGYARGLEQVAERAEADLALASDRLVAEVQRYRMTAVLLSDHPALGGLRVGEPAEAADALLLETVDKTAGLTAFYADTEGRVLASAHGLAPEGLAQARYFQRALHGALGAAHGSSAGFNRRAYSYAAPRFGADGAVEGVVVVVVDIDNLEQDWRGARPAVWFTVEDGTVFVSSRSELLGWRRVEAGLETPEGMAQDIRVEQVGGVEIWHQDLSAYVPRAGLYVSKPLPVIGMTGEALVDVAPVRRLAVVQAAAVVALCLFFGSLLFLAMERRRALALANAALEDRVRARTQDLEHANTQLRREVREREEAEDALRRAQEDLVQAGKLSALGQMSAGISHELNQPLMAIRQYAENGAAFLQRGDAAAAGGNLGRISDMAARAARIIKNLRAFARNESEPMGRVDVVGVITSAVELTEARLQGQGVALRWAPPDAPVWVQGGEVRLAQVFVNLINNAADAMHGQADQAISIRVMVGQTVRVEVADTGPGIADPERVFEPFYSTKEVSDSEGMGLGLSISYGLVQSFGGNIRGSNGPEGAVFTVELEPAVLEAVA